MDPELKLMLETIIKNQESFEKKVNIRFDGIDSELSSIKTQLVGVDNELSSIRTQLDRIENESNQDVIAMLEIINNKLEVAATKEDVNFLAGKLGQHEFEIEQLKRAK